VKNRATTLKSSVVPSKLVDYAQLVKINLSVIVVLTAVGSYLIASGLTASNIELLVLGLGGFFVTAASNALNEVLERDYDKLMSRTMNRPLAAGRMTVSEAVLAAGLFSLSGITLLALFNPFCALLGMIALILYAFVYTPLKRHSSAAVFIGAISGALPMLIGVVAYTGEITYLALSLFMIQFFWQYPHFWSIAFKGYKDYKIAGFKMVPEGDGELPSKSIGRSAIVMSIGIIPFVLMLSFAGINSPIVIGTLILLSLVLLGLSFRFHLKFDSRSALTLLFGSIIYIPLVLLVLIIGLM